MVSRSAQSATRQPCAIPRLPHTADGLGHLNSTIQQYRTPNRTRDSPLPALENGYYRNKRRRERTPGYRRESTLACRSPRLDGTRSTVPLMPARILEGRTQLAAATHEQPTALHVSARIRTHSCPCRTHLTRLANERAANLGSLWRSSEFVWLWRSQPSSAAF